MEISIGFARALLARVRTCLDRAGSPAPAEFGGILLGRVENDRAVRTLVDGFEPFPIEYRYGPNYTLSLRDRQRLEQRLHRLRRRAVIPVGFYRSHQRRGLYLDQRDFEVFQHHFRHPASVFLLVRHDGADAARASAFVWEEDDVRRHASYLEFPLDRAPAEEVAPAPRPRSVSLGFAAGLWSPKAAQVLVSIALPLSSFYIARQVAYRRAPSPRTATAKATPQPVQAMAQPDYTPPPESPPLPIAAPIPEKPKVNLASDARERSRAAPADWVPPTTADPQDRPTPLLPEPPVVAQPRAVLPVPGAVSSQPAAPGRPAAQVVAFIKPAAASSFLHKVPVLREIAGHSASNAFVPAEVIEHPLPVLPAKPDEQPEVRMLARVDRQGRVVTVKILGGDHQLAGASADTLLRWRFEPARQSGTAVESEVLFRFEFHSPAR